MNGLGKYLSLVDLTKEVAISQSIYDSAMNALSAQTKMDIVQDILNERSIIEKSLVSSVDSYLESISDQVDFVSAVSEISLANNAINSLFDSTHGIEEGFRSVMEKKNQWFDITRNIALADQITELSLRRHMSEMLSTSLAAQSNILAISSYKLGESIQANESLQQSFLNDLNDISKTYKNLFDTIGSNLASLTEFPPVITRYPPIELFRESKVLEEISIPQKEQQLKTETDFEVIPEEISLHDLLMKLDPSLPNLLRGAHQALESSNPDRARHAATSLRELFTNVVHFIAPDDNIKKWTSEDQYFHEGKPTRRARLLYVCRQINVDELSDFINADVSSAITLIDALQSGTHRIKSSLSDRQLEVIIERMESMLLYLLRLNDENQ